MNSASETKIALPDFSLYERKKVPPEYLWKITDLYADEAEWEKDLQVLKSMAEGLEAVASAWTSTPGSLFALLDYVDRLLLKEYRLYVYSSLLTDTDLGNSRYQGMKGEITAVDVDLMGRLSFMDPDILALGEERVAEYLAADKRLEIYRFKLMAVLRMKGHILPAREEELLAHTRLFSGAPGKAAGMLNDLDIPAPRVTFSGQKDNKKVALNTAAYIKYRSGDDRGDRKKAMRVFWKNREKYRNTHALLLDAGIKGNYFEARSRHYANCLEAALYPENISVEVYHNLIRRVRGNLKPLHDYLALKKRLLGLKRLEYEDLYANAVPGVEREYAFTEAKELVLMAMAPLGKEYLDALEMGFNQGWTDIWPNKGKRTGAYCNGSVYDVHPFVLMNYNGKLDHVSTLAHEFGHAMHSWFSNKYCPFTTSRYPIFLAEIASTFNETLLAHYFMKHETDDGFRLFILDQYVEHFRSTLYRQTLFAEFELAMHLRVESGQSLTPDWLCQTYLELTRYYYGHEQGIVHVPGFIENEWCGIPHFYYNFYVYQYSTGLVAATTLADRVKNGGEGERAGYLKMLKSGGSDYPLNLLAAAGVDLTGPEPFDRTVAEFAGIVREMENIAARLGK